MRPWHTLERIDTPQGPLELRQRGARDFLITISGRVLMTSTAHRSEDELARLACAALPALRPAPQVLPQALPQVLPQVLLQVLIGGLGMAYTLRAALDHLPATAKITVAELNAQVVTWCQGPLAPLTNGACADPRVTIEIADVSRIIAAAPAQSYDAILLDLYEGPHHALNPQHDPLYGAAAVQRTFRVLRPGGVLAVWSEEADVPFESRLRAAGFRVERHRSGHGGRVHVVYLALR